MATLSGLDFPSAFVTFTSHRLGTAVNRRFSSTSVPLSVRRRRISASVKTTPSLSYLSSANSGTSRRALSASASASALSTVETDYSDVFTKIPPEDRIPATVITGFLGSGKTTLLNHILTAEHGKRIAVIENEFGEVDIDGSLVGAKAVRTDDILMLNNGCLCCTVRGDLVRMISELIEKKERLDHIVIETTGLANPAPIIQTFYAEDEIFNEVKLDGIVTLVDAKHALLHLDEIKPEGYVNEAVEQVAYADRIIINKTDLVDVSEITSLVKRIKTINSMAEMKQTEFGKVDLDYVLGIGGFDLERIESSVNDDKEEDHHHDHHDHHTHDPGVSSVSLVCKGSLDLEKANLWLGTLLVERCEDIYRMKGLLSVHGMDHKFVFQGVHDIFQGSPEGPWGQEEPRLNKIVFIGKNLDKEELENDFKSCFT